LTPGLLRRQIEATNVEEDKRYGDNLINLSLDIAQFALLAGLVGAALGIGFLGVSFAFGLTVLTMAYAVGHISGGHFNCAVTIGLWAGGRFKASDVVPYVIAQVVGAILAVLAAGFPDSRSRQMSARKSRTARHRGVAAYP